MKTRLLALVLSLCTSAAFALPRFAGAGGNYGGIIAAGPSDDPNDSGILTVVLTEGGGSSLALVWQGQTYALKGTFTGDSTSGTLIKTFPKKTPATAGTKLTLNCNLDPSSRTITGVVSDPEANSGVFSLDGNPADPALVAQLEPGLRMAFMDDPVAQNTSFSLPPKGNGFALVAISRSSKRQSRTAGRLPDDQPYATGSPLRSRSYALRSGLYGQGPGKAAGGQVLGNSDLSTNAAPENGAAPRSLASFIAALRWHKKPGLTKTTAFPGGFDGRVGLDTTGYTSDKDPRFVLSGQRTNLSNAKLRITGGPLASDIILSVNVTIFGVKIIDANPHRVSIALNPRAAQFSGSFRPDSGAMQRVPFHGALRSFFGIVPGEGRGTFLSIDRNDPAKSSSGKVSLSLN